MTNTPFNSPGSFDLGKLKNISFLSDNSISDKVLVLKHDNVQGKYYLSPQNQLELNQQYRDEIIIGTGNSYFHKSTFIGSTNSNNYKILKTYTITVPENAADRKKIYISLNIDLYGNENTTDSSNFYNFTTGYNVMSSSAVNTLAAAELALDCSVCGDNPCSAIGEIDLAPMKLSSTPSAMVVANNKLYIAGKFDSSSANQTNQGAVTIIDLTTRKTTRLLSIGALTGPIQSLAYSPETNCVYGVGNAAGGQCHIVIDCTNDTIKTNVPNFLTATVLRARKVVYNSTNKKLYFLPQVGNVVTTLDTSTSAHAKVDITMSQFNSSLSFNNAITDMIHIPLSGTFSSGLNEDKMVFTGIFTNGANKQISYILSSDTSTTCNNQTFGVTLNIYGGMTYNPNNKFIYISSGNAYSATQVASQNPTVQILDNSRNLPGLTSLFNYPTSPTGYTTVNTSGITCLNNKVYVTDNNSAVGTLPNAIVVLDSASTQTNAKNPLITSGYINNDGYYSSNIISDPNKSDILYSTGTSKASPLTYKLFIFNTSKSATGSTQGTVDFPSYCSQDISASGCCSSYNCVGTSCQSISGQSGTYATIKLCEDVCKAPTLKWNCSGFPDYNCTSGSTGLYISPEECGSVCKPVPPPIRYKCVSAPRSDCIGATSCVLDYAGTYTSLSDCELQCGNIPLNENSDYCEMGTINTYPVWSNNLPATDLTKMTYNYTHIPGNFAILMYNSLHGNDTPVMFGAENHHPYYEDVISNKQNSKVKINEYTNNSLVLQPNFATMHNPIYQGKFNTKDYPRVTSHINSNGDLVLTIEAKSVQYSNENINWFCKTELFVSIT